MWSLARPSWDFMNCKQPFPGPLPPREKPGALGELGALTREESGAASGRGLFQALPVPPGLGTSCSGSTCLSGVGVAQEVLWAP